MTDVNIQVRHDKETGMYVGTDLDTGITSAAYEPHEARLATEAAVAALRGVDRGVERDA